MRIGYACLTIGVPGAQLKSCTMKNATDENLRVLIAQNLDALECILDYNIKNHILLFRISSDLIPFGSSPVNTLEWWRIFEDRLKEIGDKIRKSGMRVSMHPGQYTVLNSPDRNVVERAMADLDYHTRFLDSLGVDAAHKIILHIGGIYNDKEAAISRFIANYRDLPESVKKRLVLENDDKLYKIEEVLAIGTEVKAPVVFDNLHHAILHSEPMVSEAYWINTCKETWKPQDGPQKIHYSQQDPSKKPGSHSTTIEVGAFAAFCKEINREDLDIMLEVKDKNLSAMKCLLATAKRPEIKGLEEEWSRYKYLILEKSPVAYNDIRRLLKNKMEYPVFEFYHLVDEALAISEEDRMKAVNSALHVWGYFKNQATEKEKKAFLKNMERYQQGTLSLSAIKNSLLKLAIQYEEEYLIHSLYFHL